MISVWPIIQRTPNEAVKKRAGSFLRRILKHVAKTLNSFEVSTVNSPFHEKLTEVGLRIRLNDGVKSVSLQLEIKDSVWRRQSLIL